MLSSLRFGRWIIATLLLLIGGCSAVRLTYSQGPFLAYWWMDSYVDFTSEQAPRVRSALDDWFAWHRSSQLPEYAALLSTLQAMARQNVTPTQVCRVYDDLERRLALAFDHAVPAMAEIVRGLSAEQIDHLERRYARKNEDAQRDYLQPDLAERREAALKRVVERAESIYGALEDDQLKLIAAALDTSPFDPARWLEERRSRQRDIVRSLRALLAQRAGPGDYEAALRAFAAHAARSPRAEYRDYRRHLNEANCAMTAQLHNSIRPEQRRHALDKLRGWEEDARALSQARP